MANAAAAASAHSAAPTAITGHGSSSAAGNLGGTTSSRELWDSIASTVTDPPGRTLAACG